MRGWYAAQPRGRGAKGSSYMCASFRIAYRCCDVTKAMVLQPRCLPDTEAVTQYSYTQVFGCFAQSHA